jgi:hypothetical protein
MQMPTPLSTITILARAGSLARAEALFVAGGYAARVADPAALAVKGRLLKDRALLAAGAERLALFAKAAAAYGAADAIAPAPYLLINVASLTALSGEEERGGEIAGLVLERIAGGGIAETPYWLEATRAEALLLRGSFDAAREALFAALAHDPGGWSDHSSTLRQLALILTARGMQADWLDRFRPPKSLHYAGHLGIAAGADADLRAGIDALLAEENVGFGYGALAAGADIVIAEALLARGAVLHIILPTAEAAFIAQSVTPYGKTWLPRFRACLKEAASVKEASRSGGGYEPLATALGADMAMGAALLNARTLESFALQLLVIDEGDGPYGGGAYTARDGALWAEASHPQHILRAPRSSGVKASAGKKEGRADLWLAALLHLSFEGLDDLDEGGFARALDAEVAPFMAQVAALPGQPEAAQHLGNARLYGFADVGTAADFAMRLHALDPPAGFTPIIAGHYGLVYRFEGGLSGHGVAAVIDLHHAAIPGSVTVSEPFATVLALARGSAFRAQQVGVHAFPGAIGETRLFALSGIS